MREDNIHDISAFGGLPVYMAAMLWLFITGSMNVFYELAISLTLCYLFTTTIRLVYFRKRPKGQKYKNVLQRIDASSFPSLHAMRAAALGIILAAFFNNILMTAAVLSMILAVSITRIMLKRHHPADTIGGIAIGAIIAVAAIYVTGNYL